MKAGIAEIVGIFVVVAGVAGLVAAAAMVSTALAVTVASAFAILGGILTVYVASAIDKAEKAGKRTP